MFLPATREEMRQKGWDACDVILISGDTYIDSPFCGTAAVGRWLEKHGFRVGVIAQPDMIDGRDIARLGQPRLFWGVTGGNIDSMLANYTALKKRRKSDDFTPGGINDRRPDRAVIAYSNLIRRHFKATAPIVLGGLEASLRRIAHYDFWSDSVRRSILFDAKADFLIYGMAETPVLELARRLDAGHDVSDIRGLCHIAREIPAGYLALPDYEQVKQNKSHFTTMFRHFYENQDPVTARGMVQKQDTRYLAHNPPALRPPQTVLDAYFDLPYQHAQHPYYEKEGPARALDTIRFSVTTHRGCYGECNFCSIAVHQGRTVAWRSEASILREVKRMTRHPQFKGVIHDVGGPTANMYGFECDKKLKTGACPDKRCLTPSICASLKPRHDRQIQLLKKIADMPEIKHVFVASGIRHDLVLFDQTYGKSYLKRIAGHHVSGQLKLAPEHIKKRVLDLMGKPAADGLLTFKEQFTHFSRQANKNQFLTYYFIAAHPGCTREDMAELKRFASQRLALNPRQVQIFTPLPATWSAVMYHTEKDPFTGRPVFVEKNPEKREQQKSILTQKREPKKRRNNPPPKQKRSRKRHN